jgi:hypothetical protein
MWRSRWKCVTKPAYSVSFLLSINIFVWQNVLYFPNDLRRYNAPTFVSHLISTTNVWLQGLLNFICMKYTTISITVGILYPIHTTLFFTASCWISTRVLSQWVKQLGHDVYHSPPSHADIQEMCSYTYNSPTCPHNMERENFTFTTLLPWPQAS